MPKTLLTIGAGPGIGLSTAQAFIQHGFRAVLSSTRPGRLANHAAGILGEPTNYVVEAADARNPAEIAAFVTRMNPDVLHYNVGAVRYGPDGSIQLTSLMDMSVEEIASDIEMSLTSALAAIHAAVPCMKAKGGGTILLTGGGLAMNPHPLFLTLSAAKAALRASAQALFAPLREMKIHIGLVTVDTFVTPGSEASAGVARAFWDLHAQPEASWTWETVYR